MITLKGQEKTSPIHLTWIIIIQFHHINYTSHILINPNTNNRLHPAAQTLLEKLQNEYTDATAELYAMNHRNHADCPFQQGIPRPFIKCYTTKWNCRQTNNFTKLNKIISQLEEVESDRPRSQPQRNNDRQSRQSSESNHRDNGWRDNGNSSQNFVPDVLHLVLLSQQQSISRKYGMNT